MQRPSTFLITNAQNVSYLVATMVKSCIKTSEMDIILGFKNENLLSIIWAKTTVSTYIFQRT